jgi:2-oxoglutarate dehydrogenase E1 component
VVEGMARASQEEWTEAGPPRQDTEASLPILLHGDAAFPGEGVSAETLNLSRLPGYKTGGTIHIITNNQLGFTTERQDARSTTYASDLAKGFEIPVVHVNSDDPEACIAVTRMAHAYREKFNKDFMIDLVGYRRFGHNEGDEPAYTQPLMYEIIRDHPTVRELWARELERRGIIERGRLRRGRTVHAAGRHPRDSRPGGQALRAERGASGAPGRFHDELQARAPLPEEPREPG